MQASNPRDATACQFNSARLFYFLWLSATATALLGWWGIPAACFVLLVWVQILAGARREARAADPSGEGELGSAPSTGVALPSILESRLETVSFAETFKSCDRTRSGITKIELLVVMLIAALAIGLCAPAASEYDPMRQSEMSMKMVAKAIAAYEQQHGSLPPAVVKDEVGRPRHSWRALILPYLGEDKLAAAYRWDQPWNGPVNATLSQYRPWHYRNYDPNSDEQRELSSLQLLIDAEQNWFVIAHERSSRRWLEPAEPICWGELEELPSEDSGFWRHGFFTSVYRGRLVVSNGQTITIHPRCAGSSPALLPLEQRVALCARTEAASMELGKTYRQVHWGNALRLAMFVGAVLYPLRWLSAIRDNAEPT